MITQEQLKALLYYNAESGIFTWKTSLRRRTKIGDIAGGFDDKGYIKIGIKKVVYKAHRLAWLYVFGELPENEIDHINMIKNDNRLVNLRAATRAENSINQGLSSANTSGFKGVYWHKASKQWSVRCQLNGTRHYLGHFDRLETAVDAYRSFAILHHGDFYQSPCGKMGEPCHAINVRTLAVNQEVKLLTKF